MIRIILFILYFGTVTLAGELDSLISLVLGNNKFPEKVRTVEEYNRRKGEHVVLDFVGLVQQYEGYTAEEHKVTTSDGYILGVHRVTGSPSKPKSDGKKVVYIQHGLFGSSDLMIPFGPANSIVYQLADAGYDVWLGNVRGNTYSRAHVDYSPDVNVSTFWNFRLDEIATIDVPAMLDYVLQETKQEKLTFIGYSMGSILSHMLLSAKPEYNDKVNLVVHLAPAIYFLSPVNLIFKGLMETILKLGSFKYELLPQSLAAQNLGKSCGDSRTSTCVTLISAATTIAKLNVTAMPEILSHAPAGISYYAMEQYQQISKSDGHLRQYDYGCNFFFCTNLYYYNDTVPTEYDSTQITAPIAMFYGQNDLFVKVKDVEYLKSKLSNVVVYEKISDPEFNHMDFVWSREAKKLVYDRVLEVIAEYVEK